MGSNLMPAQVETAAASEIGLEEPQQMLEASPVDKRNVSGSSTLAHAEPTSNYQQ